MEATDEKVRERRTENQRDEQQVGKRDGKVTQNEDEQPEGEIEKLQFSFDEEKKDYIHWKKYFLTFFSLDTPTSCCS